MVSENKHLSFSSFKHLKFWDYYTLSNKSQIHSNYRLVELSEVITQRKNYIVIDDALRYKRCRVQTRGQGVILRDEVFGKEIKTKKQQLCKKDDFLVAEIDAKVGGYGIVPKFLENAIVSGHYFLFEIDKAQLNPLFLSILVKCENFSKQVKATGSTNYAAIRPYHVLEYLIPLPTLEEQNEIVEAYNKKIQLAEKQEKEAFELEKGIEQYLFKELGVEKIVVKPFKKGIINLFSYKNTIDRWDVHKGSVQAFSSLYNSKFPVQTLSDCFTFTNRSWNKKKHEKKTFNYIELGAVDPIYGVTEIKEIELDKAPSRATQFVKEGDLIIGTTRPYLKRFAIIKSQNDNDIASSGFQIIEPSNDYNLEFLLEYLKSDFGVKQFEFYMTGALYPAITGKDLRKILIPFPPIEIQNKIAKKTNEMKSKIKELNKRAQLNREQAIKEFENEIFVS